MSMTDLPLGDSPDPPFLLPSGTNKRVDTSTAKIEDGFGAVAKTVDGKTVIDSVAFSASVAEMMATVERVESAIEKGVKVKRVADDGKIVEVASVPTRSNDEIVAIVRKYLTAPGPTFISEPINGYIYVGRTPRTNDHIDASTRASIQGGDSAMRLFSTELSTVLQCLYGRIPESKTAEIQMIRTMHADPSKWGQFLEPQTATMIAILNDRNPYAVEWVVTPLIEAWWKWYASVRPSPEEVKKYYALAGSATPF